MSELIAEKWIYDWIGQTADIAAILTAVIAVWVWLQLVYARWSRRREVEKYLRLEREADEYQSNSRGLRSIQLLMVNLALTEEQVKESVFSSNVIRVWPIFESESSNRIIQLNFQYEPQAKEIRKSERASMRAWIERERKTGPKRGEES